MFQVQDGSLGDRRTRVRPVQVRPTNIFGEERRTAKCAAVVEPSHQVVEIHVAPAVRLGQLGHPVPFYRGDAVFGQFFLKITAIGAVTLGAGEMLQDQRGRPEHKNV